MGGEFGLLVRLPRRSRDFRARQKLRDHLLLGSRPPREQRLPSVSVLLLESVFLCLSLCRVFILDRALDPLVPGVVFKREAPVFLLGSGISVSESLLVYRISNAKARAEVISVIIPSHRGTQKALRLLRSIELQRDVEFEVLLVANPPDPVLKREVKALGSRFLYFESERIGANRARNIGTENARGALLVFLDDDCLLDHPLFLKKHEELHLRHPEAAAIGGPYLLSESAGALDRVYHAAQMEWVRGGLIGTQGRTRWLLGGNLSFKSGMLGPNRFDDSIVFGGTETELLARLSALGQVFIFSEELSVRHDSAVSLKTLIRKGYCQGLGKSRLEKEASHERAVLRADSGTVEDRWAWAFRQSFQAGFLAGRRGQKDIPGQTTMTLRWIRQMLSDRVANRFRNSGLFFLFRSALSLKGRIERK